MNNKDLNLLKEAYNTILENSWANQNPEEAERIERETMQSHSTPFGITAAERGEPREEHDELEEFHTEIGGINYYVGFTSEDGEITIHEIVPHEGQEGISDEPIFNDLDQKIDTEHKLSPEAKKVYNIVKERLEEEYGVSDEDRELPNEYNPFSRENPDFEF